MNSAVVNINKWICICSPKKSNDLLKLLVERIVADL